MASLRDHIESIERYVQHGIEPGSGTRAILENDLASAVAHCDPESQFLLAEIMKYIYNKTPMECWGSRQRVDAWIKAKRLQAMKAAHA